MAARILAKEHGRVLEIEPNIDALERVGRSRPRSVRPAWQWVLIIAAGVLLANALTALGARLYLEWEMRQLAAAMEVRAEEASARTAAALREQQAANEQRRLAAERHKAALRQTKETCDFWRGEVAAQDTRYNRSMQQSACTLYQQTLRGR